MLVISFPAGRATARLEQQVASLSLQSVSGTVFCGRAGQLQLQGLALGPVAWHLRPLSLLAGRLEYGLEFSGDTLRGRARAGLTLAGTPYAREIVATFDQDTLINRFSPLPVVTTGRLSLAIESLRWGDSYPDALDGHVQWADAGLLEPLQLALGRVELLLESGEGGITGTLTSNGLSSLTGDVSLTPAGRYRLELLLTPAADVSDETRETLDLAGNRQADGSYRLTAAGAL